MTKPKSRVQNSLKISTVTTKVKSNDSEHSQVEKDLEGAISLLNATLESIADGIVVIDLTGNTVTYNQKFLQMWAMPEELVEPRNTQERLVFIASQVKDSEEFLKRVTAITNQPEAEGYDMIELKDGRVFERYSKPQWLGNKIIGRVWNFRDITEQKRTEESLRQQEASLATAQRIAHVGNWETYIPTNHLSWSDEIYRIFGLAPQEFDATVEAFFSRVHPDDLDFVLKAVDDAMAGRKMYNVDHRIIQPNGEMRFVHQEAEVTFDETGKPLRMLGIVQDITERRQLEQQIQGSLERRSRQVQLSAQVAQEIATATDLDSLFQRIVTWVNERFGFYHTQLLRYYPDTERLTFIAGYGETGQQALAKGQQVGLEEGLIGLATAAGTSILIPNVSTEPYWHAHPRLPDTKGELAVPITLGGEEPQAQVTALQYFLKTGFDGFAVMALDPMAVAPVAHKTTHAGKPVVAISTDLGAQNQSALVSVSEHEMGYLLGQQAGKWAKKHAPARKSVKIGLLVYPELFGQIVEREKAIIEGIKDKLGSKFNIIRKEIESSSPEELVEWLKLHPDMNIIIGLNDGLALNAYRAVIAIDKNDPDTFFVGGVDAVDDALMAIKSAGAYQATVTQSPRQMGALAIRTLVAAIKGLTYEKVNPIKHVTVNLSNVDEFLNKDHQVTGGEIAPKDILTGLNLSQIKVGLSIMNMTNPFFVALVDGAKKEAERLGIQLVINVPRRVLGVLGVQSHIVGLLNVEDQLVLEGLCAQIAAAIESTRLRQEMEDRLHELNALQRLMSREGWQAFQTAREQTAEAYLFDQSSVRATTIDKLRLTSNGTPRKKLINTPATASDHIVAKPLAVRGEIIGALGIQNDADDPLPFEDQAFLDAIAEQVAEALERARLLEQTQKRAVEMETVAQVSSVASTILDTTKLLQEVVDLTKERFGLYHAHIYLLNEAGDTLNLAAGAGEVGRQMMAQGWSLPLTRKHLLVARAVRTRQTVIVNDVHQNPDFIPNPLLPETRSEMAVPLIGGDSVLGVLDVQADVVNRFTDEDIHVQTTLATQVAVALQNARLYAETAERATELEILSQISRRLSMVLDPQQLIAEVVEQVGVAFNYYYTQIYLFDQARENLILAGGSGETGRLLLARQHSLPKGRGLVGRAAEQNKIVLIPDVRRSIRPEIISQTNLEGVYRRETDPVLEAEWYTQYIAQYFGDVKALRDWPMVNSERAGKALKLGYVLHVPGVFPKMIQRGVEAAAHDLQVEVEFVAPLRQGDHMPLFEAMVRQAKDGLVVVPDRPEWVEPIQQAMAANIPVVTANRDLKFSPALTHVGLDNFQAGVMLGGELVKLLRAAGKKKGKILVGTGIPDRNAGVRQGLRDTNYTLIEIEGFLEDVSFLQTYWEQALNHHPDLIAVMGLTASEPPILAEIKRRTGGQWLLVGFDLELATLEAIREGIVQVTIGQHPYLQAYLPILALVEHLRLGKSLEGWMAEGWLRNPLLTETQAEVAVPIILGDEVLGVLDVQHNVVGSLKPENVNLLRSVADQVAVALQNAHLFAQTQAALAEVQQSQGLLRVTIDATPDWIFIKDRTHRFRLVNQGYANSLHTTPENIIGKNDLELGVPEDIVKGNPELGIRGFWPDDLEVMDSGKPKFIEVEPAFIDGRPVFLSTIKVPLRDAGGNVWGVLGFVRDITQREQLLAEVENLYKASRRINEAKDLQEIVVAVAEAGPVPIINRILLFTFERNLLNQVEAMTVMANWHSGQGMPPSPIGRRYSRDAFSTVGLMLSPEPLFFNDVQHDERMDAPIIAVAQQQNIRAMAVLPLQIGGRELGVLILQAEEVHEFTSREIQFYQSLAPPIAVAIDNQRLLVETRAALAEVEQTQRRYTLQAWEAYRDKLTTLSHEQVREGVTPLGDNLLPEITQTIAQSRRSRTNSEVQVILNDQRAEDSSQQTKPDSSLIVPLTVRGETIGILGLQEIDGQRVWSPEEISLIGAICEQLAQAAENIRLIDETQQRATREKRVNEIGEKIQAAQSLEEALQIAVKEVGLSLQTPQTIVQLEVK